MVGRNVAIDDIRRGKRQQPLPEEDAISDLDDAAVDQRRQGGPHVPPAELEALSQLALPRQRLLGTQPTAVDQRQQAVDHPVRATAMPTQMHRAQANGEAPRRGLRRQRRRAVVPPV